MMTNLKKALSKLTCFCTSFLLICTMSSFPMKNSHAEQIQNEQLKDMALEMAYLVNELREENGLSPLYVVPYLCDMAQVRSRECITSFSHTRPDGSKFSTVIDDNLIPWYTAFENVAAGFETEDTMEQWVTSEKHLEHMLDPNITHMGIGVSYEQNSDYEWYWSQLFVETDAHFDNEYIPSRFEIIPQAEGDITGDGIVDIFDYITLADYLYKTKNNIPVYFNELQIATADCFRDGLITEADAKVLVRYILGEYDTLPFIF